MKRKKNKSYKLKVFLKILFILLALWAIVALIHSIKLPPSGTNYESREYTLNNTDITFLYDLASSSEDGSKVYEQQIFNQIFSIVDSADNFIIIDMFLFNSDYASQRNFTGLTEILKDKLIEKKKDNPDIAIYFITDEINNFYGSYESKELKELEDAGISVIITDLTKLRDSNPYYSSLWRIYLQWFGTKGDGILKHPLGREDKKVTVRSFLKLVNTKANHRKVIVADTNGTLVSVITSANPHSASSYHSNIAFKIRGDFGNEIIRAERAVASFSGAYIPDLRTEQSDKSGQINIKLLTEGKIKKNILRDINSLKYNETIELAMFYLSDREIVESLLTASQKGANINIILDPNKDAFAREKNGIPNRPVAYELLTKSFGRINIRWYDTKGEQFHTKLLIIKKTDGSLIIYGGSANYTKRNLANLNLETSIRINTLSNTSLARNVEEYYSRIWNNIDSNYTLDFKAYREPSIKKYLIYRIQEASGFSSF